MLIALTLAAGEGGRDLLRKGIKVHSARVAHLRCRAFRLTVKQALPPQQSACACRVRAVGAVVASLARRWLAGLVPEYERKQGQTMKEAGGMIVRLATASTESAGWIAFDRRPWPEMCSTDRGWRVNSAAIRQPRTNHCTKATRTVSGGE